MLPERRAERPDRELLAERFQAFLDGSRGRKLASRSGPQSFSKTMVACMRSPPPKPLLFAEEVVCGRHPLAACLLMSPSSSERFPEPAPKELVLNVSQVLLHLRCNDDVQNQARYSAPPPQRSGATFTVGMPPPTRAITAREEVRVGFDSR